MITAFCGVDGSGKTTQAKMFAEALGHTYVKFPDRSTPIGKLVGRHLLGELRLGKVVGHGIGKSVIAADDADDALMFQALQLANRMEFGKVLEAASMDAVEAGNASIVCDRYYQSGIVYGGMDGLDVDHLMAMHHLIPNPDLNILIDVTGSLARARLKARGQEDRYESKSPDFIDQLVVRYQTMWMEAYDRNWPGVWYVVDGSEEIHEVHKSVMQAFDDYLKLRSNL